ncbi:MAG: hypothetical protein Q9191_006382 [Dirinaria sp. TL-2023a]
MFELDTCMVRQQEVERWLPDRQYPEIRNSIRRLITAVHVERQHTLEWMEYHRRRQASLTTLAIGPGNRWTADDSSDETLVSLTPSQRRRKRRAQRRNPLSSISLAEWFPSSRASRARDEMPRSTPSRLLDWLSEVPDGVSPHESSELDAWWLSDMVTAAPAA